MSFGTSTSSLKITPTMRAMVSCNSNCYLGKLTPSRLALKPLLLTATGVSHIQFTQLLAKSWVSGFHLSILVDRKVSPGTKSH